MKVCKISILVIYYVINDENDNEKMKANDSNGINEMILKKVFNRREISMKRRKYNRRKR